ncbi:beta-galactosidase [Luteipulveratus mongoliensis]|uniref:Beta-galactosidase n=1 Tax=Luteipulveratus mongoliensis TaxID=571913 RepID=A0A0K1JPR1_9MICO|nr:beta-galactosidase [Luteipulveratus mongoliensis]
MEAGSSQLLRRGIPHQILSGSVHYFRVHPQLWRDRLERVRALGLNTVDTYVAWNFHQDRADETPRWDDWRDLPQFIEIAGDLGLDVMLRPGPYICAEWANGGLPTFVTDTPRTAVRSSDPAYLAFVERWLDELIPQVAPLQSVHGGPITSVQVENEYGSFGDDAEYLAWMRDALRERGIRELLFTADGPTELMLDGGTIPGVWATATFGSDPSGARDLLSKRRPDEPFLCAEFWNGWFDHWGEQHHVRSAESAAKVVGDVVRSGGSVNLYMAHGGSNHGLWAGANHDGAKVQPTITSYDSDAPISEHGELTDKGAALREIFAAATGRAVSELPVMPGMAAVLPAQRIAVEPVADLLTALRPLTGSVASAGVPTFADLRLSSGMVLHRARPILPRGAHRIYLHDLRDRAYVFVDGICQGRLDDVDGSAGVEVVGHGLPVLLEVLVEDRGRINYGPLLGADKGAVGGVSIDRRLVHGWESVPVPLAGWGTDDLNDLAGAASDEAGRPSYDSAGLAQASFEIDEPADTFLALPGFSRGFCWVNGELIGRYDSVGPQRTTYVPAPYLRAGDNVITLLELESIGRAIELCERPDLGPSEPYVETFE